MKTLEEKEEFYTRCSEILNIDHVFKIPVPRKTRWNTRFLGNGRYKGFGTIRCFGSVVIVASKSGTRVYKTYDEVYEYLIELMKLS